jgi:hypothetical protein
MRWGNLILGALGLAILQGLVSGQGASNVGGFIAKAGTAVAWFVDPTVPAFKNIATPSTSSAPQAAVASTSGTATKTTPISPYLGGVPNPSPQTVAQGGVV